MSAASSACEAVDTDRIGPRSRLSFLVAGAATLLVVGGCNQREPRPVRAPAPRRAEVGDRIGLG